MNLFVGVNCPFKMSLTNKNEQKAYVIKQPSCHKKEKKMQRFSGFWIRPYFDQILGLPAEISSGRKASKSRRHRI